MSLCLACRRRPVATRKHCDPCYKRHRRHGTHIDLPRATHARRDVVEDYLYLRGAGFTRTQIAGKLRMSRNALDRALERAARAGDTRIDYRPRRVA